MISSFFGGLVGIIVVGYGGYAVRARRASIIAKHPSWAKFLPDWSPKA